MSFFSSLILKNNFIKHDGRPLWKYMLNDQDFEELLEELRFAQYHLIDPRDVTLYYSEWWKRNYNGGIPSKEEIFYSLKGNIRYNLSSNEFYKLARKGAEMLGVKWITKQNTLYFRTLLLQGGLPLTHISEHQGNYQNFLIAVLEEQPETIEDFMFNTSIIKLLPPSSQNDIIYENCFEIVKSILNKENYYDDLFSANESLQVISKTLKVREKTLIRKQRQSKPKNYWLLNFRNEKIKIKLNIGFADKYNPDALSNILGFKVTGEKYQFYLNDELICIFRKMVNGDFKTDWFQQQNREWSGDSKLPYAYVIEEGNKTVVEDFIQTVPNLHEPSLWSKFSDEEWLLIKGNGTSNKEGALLFPIEWFCDQLSELITINGNELCWQIFEGEIELKNNQEYRKYQSEVNSFDWTIVSQKPSWMHKASMAVVQKKPDILIYDEHNKKLPENKFKIWVKKHNSYETWQELSILGYIPLGCIDIKIEKDELVAYDMFFNVGNLQVNYTKKSIEHAEIEIKNTDSFEFKLDESPVLKILNQHNIYDLKVNTKHAKIPVGIKGSVGQRNLKKLYFEMLSPFQGMAITDNNGKIIGENEQLTISSIYGLRILSTPNTGTILRLKNRLKRDVKIIKEIKESTYPVISFKDEIIMLYYLADAMDHKNKVCLELIEGKKSKTYEISGFSHSLNVEDQFNYRISLFNSDEELELYAIPLNCKAENINLIPLVRNEVDYTIPYTEITNQFIVISSRDDNKKLMPRFVNTDEDYIGQNKEDRIESYHAQLSCSGFEDEKWKQLLSYYNISVQNDVPFSTFDQLRAISQSSLVAARAFFHIGINQFEPENFIQKFIPELEKDLGFCFHWIKKEDWRLALEEINLLYEYKYFNEIISILSSYFQVSGMQEIFQYINDNSINIDPIQYSDIRELRSKLGERVLGELPTCSPIINGNGNINIDQHIPVRLLLQSPIAVAESINGTQTEYPIWAGDEQREAIRRNIQYSQYLNPEFYNKVILNTLKAN